MTYDPSQALHCLRAPAEILCPLIKEASVMNEDLDADGKTDCHGRTRAERIKHQLDVIVDQIMDPENSKGQIKRLKGAIYGLSFALAVIEDPYSIDQARVKEEAWARWQLANPEEDE